VDSWMSCILMRESNFLILRVVKSKGIAERLMYSTKQSKSHLGL